MTKPWEPRIELTESVLFKKKSYDVGTITVESRRRSHHQSWCYWMETKVQMFLVKVQRWVKIITTPKRNKRRSSLSHTSAGNYVQSKLKCHLCGECAAVALWAVQTADHKYITNFLFSDTKLKKKEKCVKTHQALLVFHLIWGDPSDYIAQCPFRCAWGSLQPSDSNPTKSVQSLIIWQPDNPTQRLHVPPSGPVTKVHICFTNITFLNKTSVVRVDLLGVNFFLQMS